MKGFLVLQLSIARKKHYNSLIISRSLQINESVISSIKLNDITLTIV